MKRLLLILALLASPLHAAPVSPPEAGLPPEAAVAEALDTHPAVRAARARTTAAAASATALRVGPQEITAQATIQRRDVRTIGPVAEYDLQLSRPIRLPGKGRLDRAAGDAGIAAADNRADDVRHQMALILADHWWRWTGAAAEATSLEAAADLLQEAVTATERRLALRDASPFELDQARAAEAAARAAALSAAARAAAARAALAANFDGLPLPGKAPPLPEPTIPPEGIARLSTLVIERSHEIGASAADLAQADALKARAARDRLPDPSIGLRAFSEQGGNETGFGLIFSMPLGGRARAAEAARAAAMAGAASADLAATRSLIDAMAAQDAALATGNLAAWQQSRAAARAAETAAARARKAHSLGATDLADRLLADRLARDAALEEVRARTSALAAITRLRIDSHTLWMHEE